MLLEPLFHDRFDAGRMVARRLLESGELSIEQQNAVVLALPRGGVPVAFEIAEALQTPLDVFLVRKLGVPGHEELAMGAIASGGVQVLNDDIIARLEISPATVDSVIKKEQREIARRELLYREGRAATPVSGRTVILVDDGLATGATMMAAARAVRAHEPDRILVAVPVASRQACDEFQRHVDYVMCAATPDPFYAVGAWYADFAQTSDAEVQDLLEVASRNRLAGPASHVRTYVCDNH